MTIRIRNWAKHQHFKDRTPPWIKLYREILDDPDWHDLSGDDAKLLVGLWLIASEDSSHTGSLPDARKLAFRMRVSESVLNEAVNRLSQWLVHDDIEPISERYHSDAPEGETETEGETDIPVANATGSGTDGSLPAAFDESETAPKPKRKPCPFEEIVSIYHESLPSHPRVEKLTDARKGLIRQRWLQDLPTGEAWRNYFADVSKSKFLTGRTDPRAGKPPFIADLEWLCRPSSFAKVAEGKYHR